MKRTKVNRRKTIKRRPQLPTIRVDPRLVVIPSGVFATLVGALFGARIMLDRPVDRLQLHGAFQRVTPIQVEAVLAPALDSGFLSTDLGRLRGLVEDLDWVEDAEIARVWPDTLAVRVSEHQAAARWGDSGLLNTRGELFTEESRHEFPELPELAGPPGAETRVANQYLALRGRLAEESLALKVLSLDDRGSWRIELASGQVIRFGRKNLQERVDRLFEIVIPALATELERVSYVDLRYTNGFSIGWADGEELGTAEPREVVSGG